MSEVANEARLWLEQAEEEFELTKHLTEYRFYNAACFFAQQTAEKSVKAMLIFQGRRPAHTHSITELVGASLSVGRHFANLDVEAQKIDQYYVPTRYPTAIPTSSGKPVKYSEKDARVALSIAGKFFTIARREINEPDK